MKATAATNSGCGEERGLMTWMIWGYPHDLGKLHMVTNSQYMALNIPQNRLVSRHFLYQQSYCFFGVLYTICRHTHIMKVSNGS